MKRINIDDNNYIKVLPNGDFEIHCYAADLLGQMFIILRTIMVDYCNGLKEEVMAVWEKNIIYILMKNNYGGVKNNPLQSSKFKQRIKN